MIEKDPSVHRMVEGTVKVYTYSSELRSYVEVKWARVKFATGGILVGVVIFFGVFVVDQSAGGAVMSRPAHTLVVENEMLRRQLSSISPRVSWLEMQVRQSQERADELSVLLNCSKIAGGTDSSFRNTVKGSGLRSAILAAKSSSLDSR